MNVQDFTVTERTDGERRACTDGLRINMTQEYAEVLMLNIKTQLLDKTKQEVDVCMFGEIALEY